MAETFPNILSTVPVHRGCGHFVWVGSVLVARTDRWGGKRTRTVGPSILSCHEYDGYMKFRINWPPLAVPVALSAVYKQVVFEDNDLDVWYLNGWVALFQFIVGLAYAPLAAVMTGLELHDIPQNFWDGIRCVFAEMNFVYPPSCSKLADCVDSLHATCCDSCNAIWPEVSSSMRFWLRYCHSDLNSFGDCSSIDLHDFKYSV